jgi:hypothetical protein
LRGANKEHDYTPIFGHLKQAGFGCTAKEVPSIHFNASRDDNTN